MLNTILSVTAVLLSFGSLGLAVAARRRYRRAAIYMIDCPTCRQWYSNHPEDNPLKYEGCQH